MSPDILNLKLDNDSIMSILIMSLSPSRYKTSSSSLYKDILLKIRLGWSPFHFISRLLKLNLSCDSDCIYSTIFSLYKFETILVFSVTRTMRNKDVSNDDRKYVNNFNIFGMKLYICITICLYTFIP